MGKLSVLVFFVAFCFSLNGHSQVYGDVGISKRKVLTDCDRKISSSSKEGLIFIDIAVDVDGNVTSTELDEERSVVTHIILVREAKLRAKKMKFEKGMHYPKFHHGVLQFTVEKKE